MKITNVSARVIGIPCKDSCIDLMPDQSVEIDAAIAATASVSALINMGFIVIDNAEELKNAAKEAAMAEARKQVLEELKAAGKLKDENEEAVTAEDDSTTKKRGGRRTPKVPENPVAE